MLKSSIGGDFLESNKISVSSIGEFDISVRYCEDLPYKISEGLFQHIHEECEIYVNIDGDVSFMVEDTIYPISPGSVVITRPYEYHHCIYNSQKPHKHFWILFTSGGNEQYLDMFFNRDFGKGNLFNFQGQDFEKIFELCQKLSVQKDNSLKIISTFFELLSCLKTAETTNVSNRKMSDELRQALKFIGEHYTEKITVEEVAKAAHISVITLERRFEKTLRTKPYSYIRQKRLALALKLLSEGQNVTDTCLKCGFSDCSSFISLFKKHYGVTPFKYKQQIENR